MTRSRGWGPTLVVLLLAVAGVAAYLLVRSDDADDPFAVYCDAVVDHREEIGAARSAGATTGLLRALPAFEELAEEAPQDIRDEWRTVFSLDTFNDRTFVVASLLSAVSIVLASELGFLQRVLDTVELTGRQWLICICAGLAVLVVSEIRKFAHARRG